jgi:hypothetical protein
MVFLSQEQGGEAGLDNIEAGIQDMGYDKQLPIMIYGAWPELVVYVCEKGLFNFPCSFSLKPNKMFAATPQS